MLVFALAGECVFIVPGIASVVKYVATSACTTSNTTPTIAPITASGIVSVAASHAGAGKSLGERLVMTRTGRT